MCARAATSWLIARSSRLRVDLPSQLGGGPELELELLGGGVLELELLELELLGGSELLDGSELLELGSELLELGGSELAELEGSSDEEDDGGGGAAAAGPCGVVAPSGYSGTRWGRQESA